MQIKIMNCRNVAKVDNVDELVFFRFSSSTLVSSFDKLSMQLATSYSSTKEIKHKPNYLY